MSDRRFAWGDGKCGGKLDDRWDFEIGGSNQIETALKKEGESHG
jgi:hypothetical protein